MPFSFRDHQCDLCRESIIDGIRAKGATHQEWYAAISSIPKQLCLVYTEDYDVVSVCYRCMLKKMDEFATLSGHIGGGGI